MLLMSTATVSMFLMIVSMLLYEYCYHLPWTEYRLLKLASSPACTGVPEGCVRRKRRTRRRRGRGGDGRRCGGEGAERGRCRRGGRRRGAGLRLLRLLLLCVKLLGGVERWRRAVRLWCGGGRSGAVGGVGTNHGRRNAWVSPTRRRREPKPLGHSNARSPD